MALFDTDHFMVMIQLRYPKTHKQVSLPSLKPRLPKPFINVSSLRTNEQVTKAYSDLLDSKLSIDRISSDIDTLSERIGNVIRDSLEEACPKVPVIKSSDPWGDADIQKLMCDLRKTPNDKSLRKQVRMKRKGLKDRYYLDKANAINDAAEARQDEKEFSLAKSHAMHKTSSKLSISKEKLTKHFKDHF